MQFQRPLSVVTPTLDGDALTALAHADAWFTPSQLQRVMTKPWSTEGIRKVLHRLTDQGIVEVEKIGNVGRYRLNRDHLAAGPVTELANLRSLFLARIEDHVRAASSPPVYGAIFGSAARGDMETASDIDIFLVRSDSADDSSWRAYLDDLARHVTRWTGNDARVFDMTETEAIEAASESDPVLSSIAEDGVTIAGDAGWLRTVVRRQKARDRVS